MFPGLHCKAWLWLRRAMVQNELENTVEQRPDQNVTGFISASTSPSIYYTISSGGLWLRTSVLKTLESSRPARNQMNLAWTDHWWIYRAIQQSRKCGGSVREGVNTATRCQTSCVCSHSCNRKHICAFLTFHCWSQRNSPHLTWTVLYPDIMVPHIKSPLFLKFYG